MTINRDPDYVMRQKIIKSKNKNLLQITRNSAGFTLIELMAAMIILGIIFIIGFITYSSYLNKAKIAIAESSLVNARDILEVYYNDNSKYPGSIDFTSCVDENSQAVFSPSLCEQLKKDLSSIEGYTSSTTSYTLTAYAKDTKKTLLTLTPRKITKQGD